MGPTVSTVLTNAPTDEHDLTKKLIHCVDTNSVYPDMYYLTKNVYYDDSGQWGITYHEHYKVLNDKDSDVKYLFCQYNI